MSVTIFDRMRLIQILTELVYKNETSSNDDHLFYSVKRWDTTEITSQISLEIEVQYLHDQSSNRNGPLLILEILFKSADKFPNTFLDFL